MAKKKIETQIAGVEQNQPEPAPVKKLPNEPTATEKLDVEVEVPEQPVKEKPSATQSIPHVEEKVEGHDTSVEEIIDHNNVDVSEMELALGEMSRKRSVKFEIDPETIKAPAYAVEDFRGFFTKYLKEKGAKPNLLVINTNSLEKLGYRDVAVDLGLTIKESTVYKKKELVLALDF